MQAASELTPRCPIEATLDIIGDRWSILILRDAFYGVRRFDGFQQHLGISKKVLSQRLRSLSDAGLLRRIAYQQHPPRFEYRLTPRGQDMFPVLVSMSRWGNRWLAQPGKEWLKLKHLQCGCTTQAKLVCDHCGELLTPARVRPIAGGGADPDDIDRLSRAVRKSSA